MSTTGVRTEMARVWSGSAPPAECERGDDLGSYLARVRIKRGLSQPQLARKARVDTSYISRIESGHRSPSFEIVDSLSAALKLTPDEHNALLTKAGFAPDDPTSLVDPLAAELHAALATIKGTTQEARVRTARIIWLACEVNENTLFDPPAQIVPCLVRPWTRFGVRATPLEVMG